MIGKVGLLSYHFWYNYGTCFQSYALWKVLNEKGLDVEYLDFGWKYPVANDSYLVNFWSYNRPQMSFADIALYYTKRYLRALKSLSIVDTIHRDLICKETNKQFDLFAQKYIKVSKPIPEAQLDKTEKDYDLFIIGSDQVWNPECCDEKYFKNFLLDFVSDGQKKTAYAPSIGLSSIDKNVRDLFTKYLSSFRQISCREKTGKDFLQDFLGREVTQVIDPTLLIEPKEWRSLATNKYKTNGFVLCYILGNKECIAEFALNCSKKMNVPLFILTTSSNIIKKYRKNVLSGVGPSEFIELLDKCGCFVTDSFHGTAFSINFNKQFYSFMKRSGGYGSSDNSRITDTLNFFGLGDRFCEDENTNISDTIIDYNSVNKILDDERKRSFDYIEKIINI